MKRVIGFVSDHPLLSCFVGLVAVLVSVAVASVIEHWEVINEYWQSDDEDDDFGPCHD